MTNNEMWNMYGHLISAGITTQTPTVSTEEAPFSDSKPKTLFRRSLERIGSIINSIHFSQLVWARSRHEKSGSIRYIQINDKWEIVNPGDSNYKEASSSRYTPSGSPVPPWSPNYESARRKKSWLSR